MRSDSTPSIGSGPSIRAGGSHRQTSLWASLVVALGLVLAACGSDADDPPTTEVPSPSETSNSGEDPSGDGPADDSTDGPADDSTDGPANDGATETSPPTITEPPTLDPESPDYPTIPPTQPPVTYPDGSTFEPIVPAPTSSYPTS